MHDLEKPWGRSINDRALEPDAIDRWWPSLNLPKCKQRGGGRWSAVPSWRPSGSGRALEDRNPNVGITPEGIKDFAQEVSYTPLSLVVVARGCSVRDAAEWLEQYIRPEDGASLEDMQALGADTYEPPEPTKDVADHDYDRPSLGLLVSSEARAMPDIEKFSEGALREIYEYMKEAMRRHWPEAAMLVSLNVCGIAIGRNFATWTNFRSNLYTVVLARSGWGKTSVYGPAVELMIQAGMQDCIGAEKIQSDSAIITEMVQAIEHKKIFFLDEFGHMLQRCYERGAGGHSRGIITEFTNLYSKAQSFYGGRGYADGRDKGTIDSPHLNIFGMATPGQFWDAFSSGALDDGTLPRFSVLKATTRPRRRDLDIGHLERVAKLRDDVAPKLGKLFGTRHIKEGNLAKAEALRVKPTSSAEAIWKGIEDTAEEISIEAESKMPEREIGGILARVAETAAKIALILAVARNPERPMILEPDMVAGRRLAWYFAHVAIEGAMTHVADNPHEAASQRILEFIRKGEGARRIRSEVVKYSKLPARDLDGVLTSLIESELIARDEMPRSDGRPGRGRVIYTALKDT